MMNISLNPLKLFGSKKIAPNLDTIDLGKSVYRPENSKKFIQESFQGITATKKVRFPAELGEEHLFDMKYVENVYMNEGYVSGTIDKYIDFVIGPGFYIECEDDRAKQIIEDLMRDLNFDTLLRAWLKEALGKGSGFMELSFSDDTKSVDDAKVLDAAYMYVQRDKFGEVEGYNQYTKPIKTKVDSKINDDDIIPFKPYQIAHLPINKVGDKAYGLGIVAPALRYIEDAGQLRESMKTLMKRKANTPIHAKLGRMGNTPDEDIVPQKSDITSFGQDLEYLEDRHEWATGPYVEFKTVDFGKVGEKFEFPLGHTMELYFATVQIPGVLLGHAEGTNRATAEQTVKVFKEGKIKSIQAEMEKVIEAQIFKPVLEANGFDVHVEFQWGMPSNEEKNERADRLINALKNPVLSFKARDMLEKDLIDTLDLDVEELETAQEERDKEEAQPQPVVPGQQQQKPTGQVPPKPVVAKPIPEEEKIYDGCLIYG